MSCPPPLQLVNSFLRQVQKGHLPNRQELEILYRTSPSRDLPCPSLESVINAVNKKGDSAFLVAARHGHVELLRRLHRDHGVPLEHSNADGKTALHEAAQNGQTSSVEYLIGEGAEVDALKRADWTPLMLACTKQELSTIQALVGYGASLTATNKDGWTPFHLACREGSTDIVSFLLTTDTGCWSSCSKNGRTPLHSAALHGNLEVVKILHERCTYDVNSADSCGVCPLMDAARGNHMGVVTYLVEVWRADSFSADILGRRALHHASQSGAGLVIRYLVAAGADVNEPVSVNAITPLHYAAKEGQVTAVDVLLSLGADPSLTDKVGRTALDVARSARDAAGAVLLLERATPLGTSGTETEPVSRHS